MLKGNLHQALLISINLSKQELCVSLKSETSCLIFINNSLSSFIVASLDSIRLEKMGSMFSYINKVNLNLVNLICVKTHLCSCYCSLLAHRAAIIDTNGRLQAVCDYNGTLPVGKQYKFVFYLVLVNTINTI